MESLRDSAVSVFAAIGLWLAVVPVAAAQTTVEQWDVFELTLRGPTNGNPFLDIRFAARFGQDYDSVEAPGFYDGEGIYRVRFMPPQQGIWKYITVSTAPELNEKKGEFTVTKPSAHNHGPVRVVNTFHFAYADGKPFKPLGTTCYVWTLQGDELEAQTLKTLASSPFNKVRFCVFPKRYNWNSNEPPMYPFEGKPRNFDTTRFNPKYFQHLERRVLDLQRLGIEADIILLHPYDQGAWGFDRMTALEDDRYLRYVVARLAALRNVWWSLANEYDFLEHKTEDDWERMGELVSRAEPHRHLLSIHNGKRLFNQTRSWLTHASIQNGSAVEDAARAVLYRDAYRKPIVFDEVKYEGDVPKRWGNLSAEEMVFRFWQGTVAGTYVGHGETYLSPDDVLWWSKGGVLKGQSPARLAFLRQVLEDSPPEGIEPIDKWQNPEYGGQPSKYYLVYLGKQTPASWEFKLPKPPQDNGTPPADGMKFTAEVLDTWNMTVTPVEGVFTIVKKTDYFHADKDGRSIKLPGRPYMAIRIKRVK
ncbi:MAG TPA: DUF5060 domain-containing protein [Haliangiales bacterium]|nr:DUF5060 domain-containing protein [Haliangiales bacterium]